MNPIVDTIMLILFVLFMVWIVNGFVKGQYEKKIQDVENNTKDESEKTGNN